MYRAHRREQPARARRPLPEPGAPAPPRHRQSPGTQRPAPGPGRRGVSAGPAPRRGGSTRTRTCWMLAELSSPRSAGHTHGALPAGFPQQTRLKRTCRVGGCSNCTPPKPRCRAVTSRRGRDLFGDGQQPRLAGHGSFWRLARMELRGALKAGAVRRPDQLRLRPVGAAGTALQRFRRNCWSDFEARATSMVRRRLDRPAEGQRRQPR